MHEDTTPTENAQDSEAIEGQFSTTASSSAADDPAGRLVVVANAAMVGVPAAYMTTQSVPVTLTTAGVAVAFAILARRRR
ncbi:hypothetical protein ACBR40_45610 [Nonomuraea sp. AD125B]|uniref:hypothetical protein n=1 Tax=Nonomuraea sp. AD125B TaxID=3242897 RepID=UPI00352748E3